MANVYETGNGNLSNTRWTNDNRHKDRDFVKRIVPSGNERC